MTAVGVVGKGLYLVWNGVTTNTKEEPAFGAK